MKNLIYILFFLPVLAKGQTNAQNYVKTLVYKDSTPTSNALKAKATVNYYDGLGRPIQQIANKQSGTGKDIITHMEYDGFGRQSKEYLPYVASTDNMAFDPSAQANTVAFYNTASFENTSNPYSEKFLDASPLNRVLKQGFPGTSWLGNTGNDADHTVKFAYLSNTANDAVKDLRANATWNSTDEIYDIAFVSGSNYAAGKLYKTITQDENKASAIYTGTAIGSKLNTTEEYKNQLGQVILKRTFNQVPGQSVVALDTYYVYDQFGNLTYVLPPLANGGISQLDALCYQYKYDYRNRMVEKKLPGKAWEFIIYDKLDHPVATGPTLNPWGGTDTGWTITRYDNFGRVAYIGWYSASGFNSSMRKTFQTNNFSVVTKTTTATVIDNVNVYYTNVFPTTGMKVLSINYYDNYTFSGGPSLPPSIETQAILSNVKGLTTGSWVRALTDPSQTFGQTTYILYDNKGRAIRTRTVNYLGGYTETDSKLDFDGTVLYSKTRHKRLIGDDELVTLDEFAYTQQDRLLFQTHAIGSQTPKLMARNTYNALGQLISKNVGNTSTSPQSPPLQQVNYTYNIRGWLTAINNVLDLNNLGTGSQPQDLFAFKINYNNTVAQTMSGSVNPLFNGNIAETSWRSASDNIQRRYGYTYDGLNRMTNAWYQMPQSSVQVRNSYNEQLSYDNNGNITSLQRNGELDSSTTVTQIDDLTYTYSGNRLTKVGDATNNPAGFKDINLSNGNDYAYDVYGNMTSDVNKGISAIVYNHLNLPTTITIGGLSSNNGTISYLYDAAGTKLKKTVTNNANSPASVTTTDYLGGYQYQNTVLEFFPTSEGYVKHTLSGGVSNYNYVFQYKDHLGNNRVSYTVDPADNILKILEEDHYYPFGLKHNGYSATQQMLVKGSSGTGVVVTPVINPSDATYKYMYQEQELQDELGLGWYSFKWRNYNPEIGRFMNIDPLAEKYAYQSPYNFSENRVIDCRELEGLEAWHTNDDSTDPDGDGLYRAQSGPLSSTYAKDYGYSYYTDGEMEPGQDFSFSDEEIQSFADWNAEYGPSEEGHCLGCAITGSEKLTGADAGYRDSQGVNQMEGTNAFDLGENLERAGVAVELPKIPLHKETDAIANNPNSKGTVNTAYVAGISAAWHTIIIVHNTKNKTFSIYDQGTNWDKKNTTQKNIQSQINEMYAFPKHGSRIWQLFKPEVHVKHPIE